MSNSTIVKPKRFLWLIGIFVCRIFFFFTCRRIYGGGEYLKLKREKGYIIILNHNSYIDPVIYSDFHISSCNTLPIFMAKRELFKIPLLGLFLKHLGLISVKRNTYDTVTGLRRAIQHIKSGNDIVIYPEGTINKSTVESKNIKDGAVAMAMMTGALILPVAHINVDNIFGKYKNKSNISKFKKVNVFLQADKPIDITKIYGRKIDKKILGEASTYIMDIINNLESVLLAKSNSCVTDNPSNNSIKGEY